MSLGIVSSKDKTGLRTEWTKCHARASRWSEEVTLLIEEMRCVLWYLSWKRQWWVNHAHLRTDARLDVQMGLAGYAEKQAALLFRMGKRFADEWYPILIGKGFLTEWPEEFLDGRFEFRASLVASDPIPDDDVLDIVDDVFD